MNILDIKDSIQLVFQYWPLIILLNIYFLYASYTDIKTMKIYDNFNLLMLVTRIVSFIIMICTKQFSWLLFTNYIVGALIMFLAFLIPAMITWDSIGGDIKFAFNVGLWVGIVPSLFITLTATIFNIIWRILFVGSKDKEPYFKTIAGRPIFFTAKKRVPLGPFFYFGYILLGIIYLIIF